MQIYIAELKVLLDLTIHTVFASLFEIFNMIRSSEESGCHWILH